MTLTRHVTIFSHRYLFLVEFLYSRPTCLVWTFIWATDAGQIPNHKTGIRMVEKVILRSVFIFFFLATKASGQGLGAMTTNGWGGSISIQRVDNTTRFELDLGALHNPLLEGGLTLMREEANNSDLAVSGAGPYLSIYPLRQSNDVPLTVGIHTFFRFLFFSGNAFEALDSAGFEITGNDIYLYGSLLHSVVLGDGIQFIPEIELGMARLQIVAQTNTNRNSESEIDIFGGVGGRFVVNTAAQSKLAFVPQMRFSEGNSVFRFSVILLLVK